MPASAIALSMALCHCESVPDLRFAGDDDASDAADAEVDTGAPASGIDSGADAFSVDGGTTVDAAIPDAFVDSSVSSCPVSPPKGASACCNAVACQGGCSGGDCQKCETQCAAPGLVCCTARKPLTCVPLGTACP